jgi:HrpA-like RNA helicase
MMGARERQLKQVQRKQREQRKQKHRMKDDFDSSSSSSEEEEEENEELNGNKRSMTWRRRSVYGYRMAVTQPRRVAAISVAKRVADEMAASGYESDVMDGLVGYRVRFEDATCDRTLIKYVTDGMLLREAILDPLLKEYQVVVLDEAHERTVQTDILFGVVKRAQRRRAVLRRPLKVLVMSATLAADSFSRYFDAAKVLYVEGRQFPVRVMYTPEPEPDYLDATLIAITQIHLREPAGDVLAFLTGQEDIDALQRLLEERARKLPEGTMAMRVCPIYSALPPEKQLKVFEPAPDERTRKVILATNIAETSITINGVRYVVDCGLVKARGFNARTGVDALLAVPVSQAAARQRAGRAGREAPGTCYRLYTEDAFESLDEQALPEIQRCSLDHVLLQLKALRIDDVVNFDYLSPPPLDAIRGALKRLLLLGALAPSDGALTEPLGRAMAHFPLTPMFAKTLFESRSFSCVAEVLTVTAMLSVDSVFYAPRAERHAADKAKMRFRAKHGDHLTLLNVYEAFVEEKQRTRREFCRQNFLNLRTLNKALAVRRQLAGYCLQLGIEPSLSCFGSADPADRDPQPVRDCFVSGFFLHTAVRLPDGQYRNLADGNTVYLHPTSVLFQAKPACVIYTELIFTTKAYMRDVLSVDMQSLMELAPNFYRQHQQSF